MNKRYCILEDDIFSGCARFVSSKIGKFLFTSESAAARFIEQEKMSFAAVLPCYVDDDTANMQTVE